MNRRRKCEWCGRTRNLEPFGDGAFICRNQKSCEEHWPDEWPEGTRGVPADRIAGSSIAADLTSCDELELRRRAANGDQDAEAERRRRNRIALGRAQANPKDHRAPDRREPSVGYVSTGRKSGIGSGGGSVGSLVA